MSLSHEEVATAVGAMREGLQIIDRGWRYVFLNDAAAAHGRRAAHELIGKTMMECYPGIDETPLFDHLRAAMGDGRAAAIENVFRYPDDAIRTFELRIEPCPVGIIILSLDVTDRRRLEDQFRHAQKMEAIGRLASGVAHDFNNLLSVILSYSSMLLEDLRPLDPLRDDLLAIQRAGERAADLTRQLLVMSRQQPAEVRVTDLNALLSSARKILERIIGADVELTFRLDGQAGAVMVDPGHFDQVVMNLVVNARDAMPDGGKLTIETRDVLLDEAYAAQHLEVTPGRYTMLAVSDTGIGMDRATQERIFEPFFTTKDKGKGTGLGLSTVFGIVRQFGGSIWVYSEPGAGTTFKVYLPRAEPGASSAEAPAEPESLLGNETILLAEDDPDVRRAANDILRRYGYRVLEASNGGEALIICERHPLEIHLLLTDVIMPRMSGRELATRLCKLRPDMKVLFMSGYTDNGVVEHAILDPNAAYIQKPLVPDGLARQVRRVLSGAATRR